MKKTLLMIVVLMASMLAVGASAAGKVPAAGVVNEISQAQYKTLVSDYSKKAWNFKGKRPAIVDFSATWCGPCKRLAPILDELAKTYKGKIDFYKVDVDQAKELSKAYEISSVPTVLFIPTSGKPTSITGLYSKDEIEKVINQTFFNVKKK